MKLVGGKLELRLRPPPFEETVPFEVHRYDPGTGTHVVEDMRLHEPSGYVFALSAWEPA